jgi:hypothetical protein
MSSKKVSKVFKTLDQIKREKGATRWGRLIVEQRSADKKVQLAQKASD